MIGSAAAALAVGLLAGCGEQRADGDGGGVGAGSASAAASGAASGAGRQPAADGTPALTGVRWGVESLTADGERTAPPRGGAYIEIGQDGRIHGTFGCNSFSGEAAVDGTKVTVGSLARTEMYCGNDFEDRAFAVLEGGLTAKEVGGKLRLSSGDGDFLTLAELEPVPLTGTKWQVNAVLHGDAATSLPQDAKPHLTFRADGRVTGNLGCNEIDAEATIHENGTLSLRPVGTTYRKCPEDVMRTERALYALFEGGGEVEYKITHRVLQLVSGDNGLSATAAEGEK